VAALLVAWSVAVPKAFAQQPLSHVKAGSDVADEIGDVTFPLIGAVTGGLALLGSERDEVAARRTADGLLGSVAICHLLKHLTNEPRPNDPEAQVGFPSGHATAAAAFATAMAHEYPRYRLPAYAFAGAVTWARRASRDHTWAQSLAGAALGWGVMRWSLSRPRGLWGGLIVPGSAACAAPAAEALAVSCAWTW
jgi:hypothetical protein